MIGSIARHWAPRESHWSYYCHIRDDIQNHAISKIENRKSKIASFSASRTTEAQPNLQLGAHKASLKRFDPPVHLMG